MMCTLWENYSGCDLELRKYISRIFHSILQRMHGSGTQVYGARDLTSSKNPVYIIVRSQVTAQISTDPLISVRHFLPLSFLIFKLPGSIWNRFKWILLDQEMNLEKKIIEKYFFMSKKYFPKKFKTIFENCHFFENPD